VRGGHKLDPHNHKQISGLRCIGRCTPIPPPTVIPDKLRTFAKRRSGTQHMSAEGPLNTLSPSLRGEGQSLPPRRRGVRGGCKLDPHNHKQISGLRCIGRCTPIPPPTVIPDKLRTFAKRRSGTQHMSAEGSTFPLPLAGRG